MTETLDASVIERDLDSTDVVAEEAEFSRLQHTFEKSSWARIQPEEVEVEVHLVFDGHIVVCKIDAIFKHGDRYQIVDWKTGKAPTDKADLELKQLQLALYRLAYSRWKNIDPSLIDAVFYFVSDDSVVVPERLYSEEDLLRLWRSIAI